MVASLESHRQSVQQALADLRAWGGRLDTIAEQYHNDLRPLQSLAESRENELFASRTEIERLRQELDAARQAVIDQEQNLQTAQARADELANELEDSRLELEAVLDRSAQVAEDAARLRRQSAAERAGYEAEIKALRQLFVQQQELAAQPEPAPPVSPRASGSSRASRRSEAARSTPAQQETDPASAATTTADPVVDAVLAQFDELKRANANAPRMV